MQCFHLLDLAPIIRQVPGRRELISVLRVCIYEREEASTLQGELKIEYFNTDQNDIVI